MKVDGVDHTDRVKWGMIWGQLTPSYKLSS